MDPKQTTPHLEGREVLAEGELGQDAPGGSTAEKGFGAELGQSEPGEESLDQSLPSEAEKGSMVVNQLDKAKP